MSTAPNVRYTTHSSQDPIVAAHSSLVHCIPHANTQLLMHRAFLTCPLHTTRKYTTFDAPRIPHLSTAYHTQIHNFFDAPRIPHLFTAYHTQIHNFFDALHIHHTAEFLIVHQCQRAPSITRVKYSVSYQHTS